MKFLILGDLHLTSPGSKPRSRIDDYQNAQFKKMEFILDLAVKENVSAILQPGDFCDKFISPDKFKTIWIRFFKKNKKPIYAVYGQHDCRYHTSNIDNTPFGVLAEALDISVIKDDIYFLKGDVAIYGAGWGINIPKIKTGSYFNILLTHRMITPEKLWHSQEDYELSSQFLRRYKFDLIVSGDNHQSFYVNDDNRWLINCGSLMRSKTDQLDHKPCVWIFDVGKQEAAMIYVPIQKSKEVFSLSKIKKIKEENKKLEHLKDILKEKSNIKGLKFAKRISKRIILLKNKGELDNRTEKILNMVMEDD